MLLLCNVVLKAKFMKTDHNVFCLVDSLIELDGILVFSFLIRL